MKVEEAVEAKRAPVQPNKRVLIGFGVIAAIILLVVTLMPEGQEDFGFLSVIPALFLVGYIFWTKRILEALLLATGLGFLFVHKL